MTTKTIQDPSRRAKPDQAPISTPEEITEMMEGCCCGPMMKQMMEACLRKAEKDKKKSTSS
jgi:hypothetical protein